MSWNKLVQLAKVISFHVCDTNFLTFSLCCESQPATEHNVTCPSLGKWGRMGSLDGRFKKLLALIAGVTRGGYGMAVPWDPMVSRLARRDAAASYTPQAGWPSRIVYFQRAELQDV